MRANVSAAAHANLASIGHIRFMLLHDVRNDEGINKFFHDVHELYVKVTRITSLTCIFTCAFPSSQRLMLVTGAVEPVL